MTAAGFPVRNGSMMTRFPPRSSTKQACPWNVAFTLRSEERRVGKECRSLCDWSSDVCSSDLDDGGGVPGEKWVDDDALSAPLQHKTGVSVECGFHSQIGRASCRERV